MSNTEPTTSMPFPQAARACAKWIAIALPLVIALLALVGKAVEERSAIKQALVSMWDNLMWLASFGGHFWGAVAIGITALACVAWSICVLTKLPKECPSKIKGALVLTALVAGGAFLLAAVALHAVYDDIDALTVYQAIAVYTMRIPLFVAGLASFGIISFAAFDVWDSLN